MRAGDAPQLGEELVDLRLLPDRIAADERRAGDDAVGEERPARRREEIALVAAEREEGEAVGAVRVHERARHPPLPHRLRDSLSERPQPEVEGGEAEDDAEAESARPPRGAAARRRAARLAGATAATPASAAPSPSSGRTLAGSPGTSKRRAPADQGDEQEQRDRRLLEVEALREVRRGRRDDDDDCELPGAPAALRERAREPDQPERAGDREDARGLRPARRQHAAHELDAVRHLRRQRRDDPDHADPRRPPTRAASRRSGLRSVTRPGYNVPVTDRDRHPQSPSAALGRRAARASSPSRSCPWILYLTFTLPSRHVTFHYDLAWVGFDVGARLLVRRDRVGSAPRLALARAARRRHRDDALLRRVVRRRHLPGGERAVGGGRGGGVSPSCRSPRSARSSSTTPRPSSPRRSTASGASREPRPRWNCARRRRGSALATPTPQLANAQLDERARGRRLRQPRQRRLSRRPNRARAGLRRARAHQSGLPSGSPQDKTARSGPETALSGSRSSVTQRSDATRPLLEQAQPMLELGDAQLELVELLARSRGRARRRSRAGRKAPAPRAAPGCRARGSAARRSAPRPCRGAARPLPRAAMRPRATALCAVSRGAPARAAPTAPP